MRWIRRKKAPATDAKPAALKPPTRCTCHIFDMGPRCDFCVDACGDKGHPLGTHPSGHPDYCFCGDIDRRYGTRKPTNPPDETRTCPDCGALCSGTECTECGHSFPPGAPHPSDGA